MGLFRCDLCDENLGFIGGDIHKCDPEKIKSKIKMEKLQKLAMDAENHLEDIRNAVYKILQQLPSMDGPKATVDTDWIRRLWDAAECRWWEAKTADSFLVHWLASHRILVEAFQLFRSKEYGKSVPKLEKLKQLREACDYARKVLGYDKDGDEFDVSPEDLV